MSKLNRDILYLIFEELKYDKNTLYSCLSVNKIWCEVIIPILWKNPWRHLNKRGRRPMLNVILSYLTDELKNNLKKEGIRISYQRPLFDYISFCKHLSLQDINRIISVYKRAKRLSIKNVIFDLFINENTNYTHLYIPQQSDCQIHLIPGAKHCFSTLEFFYCSTSINDDVLIGLSEICSSIRELELSIESIEYMGDNYGIIKLIEAPKNLYSIRLLTRYSCVNKSSFCKFRENSLIKHANTLQYLKITNQHVTKFLSSFVNLKGLELEYGKYSTMCDHLYLPSLQILKVISFVPITALTSFIENTNGHLTEIVIGYAHYDEINNKKIIQAIYKNCPNLKYLKSLFRSNDLLELENLL